MLNKKNKDGFKIIGASDELKNNHQAWTQQQEASFSAINALNASIHKTKSNKRKIPKDSTLIIWKKKDSNVNNNNNKNKSTISKLPIFDSISTQSTTAYDIFYNQTTQNNNITCCNKEIDSILCGGIELGKITEFCGLSGTGKTQIGLQLACDVQLPHILGGIGGQCIYIVSSVHSVIGNRLYNISKSFIHHIYQMANKRNASNNIIMNNIKEELGNEKDMMNNILILNCFTFNEFDFVLMKLLDEILSGNNKTYSSKFNKIKLIVIDSISFLIKYIENLVGYICKLGQLFHYLCKKYNIAIVCMNQMTTKMSVGSKEQKKFNKNMNGGIDDNYNEIIPLDAKYIIAPNLGYFWSAIVNIRIQLLMVDENRYAKLIKTCKNIKTNQSAKFKISNGGIRNFKGRKKK